MCVCMPFAIILDGDRIICFHMLSHHAFSLAFDPVARAVNCFFAKPQRGPGTISWTLTWVDYSFDKLIAKKPSAKWLSGQTDGSRTAGSEKVLKRFRFYCSSPILTTEKPSFASRLPFLQHIKSASRSGCDIIVQDKKHCQLYTTTHSKPPSNALQNSKVSSRSF